MNDMEEVVLLKIQTMDGDIEIPFYDLMMLDEFTVRYKNKDELLDGLISMLGLQIDKKKILEVYVYYEYRRNDRIRKKTSRVKYREHNFDMKTLSSFLKEFLEKNHDMIHCCGVRKIRSRAMYDFIYGNRDIEDFEISFAVDKYFEGAPYGVYRKIYFFLLDNGVKVNINRFERVDKQTVSRNLSKFQTDDDYIQSLLKRAKDSDSYDSIYDELSRVDLEDLKGVLTNPRFGLFDGVDNDKGYQLEDLYDLQMTTGMDIDTLSEVASVVKTRNSRR